MGDVDHMPTGGGEGLEEPLGGVAAVEDHVHAVEGQRHPGVGGAGVVNADVGVLLPSDGDGAVGDGRGRHAVDGGQGCGHDVLRSG